MISNLLINNIEDYINRIGVVPETQIHVMFGATHGDEAIEWCCKALVADSRINFDKNDRVYSRRQNVDIDGFGQRLLTRAAWVLAHMKDSNVRDYWPLNYPNQLLIISEDNIVYDITVFTYQTLSSLLLTVKSRRADMIPNGVNDEIIHIAVLPDMGMKDDIAPLLFDGICTLADSKNYEPIWLGGDDNA